MVKKVKAEVVFPSDSTLADMARVVILFSAIENTINIGIASILGISFENFYLTINPIRSFDTRKTIYRNLVDYEFRRGKVKLAKIANLFKNIQDHYDYRNLIAHGQWKTYRADDPLVNALMFHNAYDVKYQKVDKVMVPKNEKLTPKELKVAIVEFQKTQRELEALTREAQTRILDRHFPSLKKQK